jgi:outer membrane protein assembly factor BamA
LANPNPDSTYQAWLHKKDKREQRLINWLSKKQVHRLGESFLVKGASEWLKNIGEPPAVIDEAKTKRTIERLQAYYHTEGYFNNEVEYNIVPEKKKQRASLEYLVDLGKPYFVDSLTTEISSTAIDSLYQKFKDGSRVKQGQQFNLNRFTEERERLTFLFRNTGVYNFQESSIAFNILRDTLLLNDDQSMDVQLEIGNLRQRNEEGEFREEYKIHSFKKINIYPDYLFAQRNDSLKSIDFENYTIYFKDKLRYKPKALTNAIFMQQDSIYRELDKVRTYRQIANLNAFKYPSITVEADSSQNLTANIYLASRPKFSLGTDFNISHSNIQRLGVSFSSSLVSRNIFRGAETLSISARGTFGLLSDKSLAEDFFSEVGGDVNLTFPRMWFPLIPLDKVVPAYMLPQTKLSTGITFQQNIGLDKRTFNTVFGYNWTPNDFKRHNFELLNIQYVKNVNFNRFFNVYQRSFQRLDNLANGFENTFPDYFETPEGADNAQLIIPDGTTFFTNEVLNNGLFSVNSEEYEQVRSIEERRKRLTENNLIVTTNYTFNKNNKSGINDNDFYQFRFKVESAGNLLSLTSNLIGLDQENNKDLVFGVPFSQYVKTEWDYIKNWNLSRSNVLAFRTFMGIAIPYGNSDNVPFVRSYFAGGSNDNRAWNPYSLGPGRTSELNDFNEANFKLSMNLEYRFPIVGDFKGALFADAGNIWNVLDNVENQDAVFSGFDSLSDIALGTGFGLRYDLTYFLFRLDFGFKTHDPSKPLGNRWFSEYNFSNAVFNIGINYPF